MRFRKRDFFRSLTKYLIRFLAKMSRKCVLNELNLEEILGKTGKNKIGICTSIIYLQQRSRVWRPVLSAPQWTIIAIRDDASGRPIEKRACRVQMQRSVGVGAHTERCHFPPQRENSLWQRGNSQWNRGKSE